jgi:molecular chaperone DnaK (HSP70)
MLLLYFTFFIVLYNFYKNFTYIIGLFIIIIFKIFNIDTTINSNSINLVNKFLKIENATGVMDKVRAKSNAKESELNDNADNAKKNNKEKRNPAKEHIIDALQKARIKPSNDKYNHESKKDSAESDLNKILAGHHTVQRPVINNNMSY